MESKIILTIDDDASNPIIPKDSLDIWVSKKIKDDLYSSYNLNGSQPIYVSIKCDKPLRKFITYGKLQELNSANNKDVVVSKMKFDTNMVVESGLEVDLSFIDLAKIPNANSLIIKLRENEVSNWAESEEKYAKNVIKSLNDIAFLNQYIWIKSENQKILGKVIKILPAKQKLYKIDQETELVLEGLPIDKQKSIDFSKIGGLDHIIRSLREIIQVPILFPHLLDKFNITPPRGLLLHGPPGNGKTLIARSIAYSLGTKFYSIQGPEFSSKYAGEGERRLREAFAEARSTPNSVLFIDEIDSLAPSRDKSSAEHVISMVSTLLNEMDGITKNSNLFVIGATNRVEALDSAIRRPGRLELEFEIKLPSKESRLDILKKTFNINKTTNFSQEIDDIFLENLSSRTNGYSGADLISFYRQSAMLAINRNLQFDTTTGKIIIGIASGDVKIDANDINNAFKKIVPTETRATKEEFEVRDWDSLTLPISLKDKILSKFSLDSNFSKIVNKDFKNIILEGIPGSGKATILRSLARHYNFEYFEFNLLSFVQEDEKEILNKVSKLIHSASLVFPSIVYLQNAQFYSNPDLLIEKVCFEVKKVKSYSNLVLCLESLEDNFSIKYLDYDKFELVIKFNEFDLSELSDEIRSKLNSKNINPNLAIGRIIKILENEN